MALFTVGNVVAYFSPNYESLIIARIITGLAHGVFFSIGSTIATSLVSKDKEASAIAIMFTGLTVALVTGVPLGTFIGQEFGWRFTFLAVSSLGIISFIGSLLLIPSKLKQGTPTKISQQLTVLVNPRLVLVYLITALGYGGTFIAFTYLVPILEQVTGFDSKFIAILMLIYGVSVAVGNIWGGKLADKLGPVQALYRVFIGLALILLAFTFTATNPYLAVATILIWGAFAFGNVPGLQVYVVQLAQKHAPHAVDTASGLNIAAFNVGIAFGAWVGGIIVDSSSLMNTPWIGSIIVVFALALTHFSGVLDKKAQLRAIKIKAQN